jgi:two-component system, NtrC family, response regulator AtoC
MRVSPIDPQTAESDGGALVRLNHFYVWGISPAMQALRRTVADTAATDIPVLVLGEGGAGKEVLALQIHRLSDRRDEPFIKTRSRAFAPGRLPVQLQTLANGTAAPGSFRGTVFLDDLHELEPAGQRQLLDLLAEGDGLPGEYSLSARVISSARRGLEDGLRSGKFEEELYFRLNGICLRIPPLRERREDLPELADFFLTKYASLFERSRPVLSPELLERLGAYSWPGNVRQLENTMKKIVATSDCESAFAELLDISPETLKPVPSSGSSLKAAARAASRHAERELISRALTRTHWNRKKAAGELQISYKALLYKLKQLGLEGADVS